MNAQWTELNVNYLNVNSEPFIMVNTLTNLGHQGYLNRYGSSLLFGFFFKYSSINSKLSELQMKAKILPFIQRQGMCPETPMGPSATETATDSSLPASSPAYPVSKATVEPGDGCKGGNRDPTRFSCLSVISHCLRKNPKCTNRKASQTHKMSAHGFILSHLWWVIPCVAQARISETTWVFESFCWYSNEQALFVTLLFTFYLVTVTFPPDEDCMRSPLEHDA